MSSHDSRNEKKRLCIENGLTDHKDLGVHGDYYVSILVLGPVSKMVRVKRSEIEKEVDWHVARWNHDQHEIKIFHEEVRQSYQTYLQEKYRDRF